MGSSAGGGSKHELPGQQRWRGLTSEVLGELEKVVMPGVQRFLSVPEGALQPLNDPATSNPLFHGHHGLQDQTTLESICQSGLIQQL